MDEGTDAERRRRVQRLEEQSYRQGHAETPRAAGGPGRAAAGHERAARLHERMADLGWGDVEEHRERAGEHREDAQATRDGGEPAGPDWADDDPPPIGPHPV